MCTRKCLWAHAFQFPEASLLPSYNKQKQAWIRMNQPNWDYKLAFSTKTLFLTQINHHEQHNNSFYPQAIFHLNNAEHLRALHNFSKHWCIHHCVYFISIFLFYFIDNSATYSHSANVPLPLCFAQNPKPNRKLVILFSFLPFSGVVF